MEQSAPLFPPPPPTDRSPAKHVRVVALAGGVGGAKLVWGLAQILPASHLTVIGNVGDDFEHLGLHICPDLDTLMYTLAGMANTETGWGIRDDTWAVKTMLARYAAPTWFGLGDADIATHIIRTMWLRQGFPLTWVTRELCKLLGVGPTLLPATDNQLRTVIHTPSGPLPFQEWFVREAWQPPVTSIEFEGVASAQPSTDVVAAFRNADVVILCPSNPYVSLDPILVLPAIRRILSASKAKKVAVSPIVGSQAVKGPAAKMMAEMGFPVSATTVAAHFQDLLTGFVLDDRDRDREQYVSEALGLATLVTDIVMKSPDDQARLATEILEFVSAP